MPLIVFEGPDGCGKTTQSELLVQRLRARGRPARRLREPGGTPLGEAVRAWLLDPAHDPCPTAELFGYLMARAELCQRVLIPALAAGEWLVLDRFWHSTLAYQAWGLGLDPARVRAAIELAIGGLRADLAVLLAVSEEELQRRRAGAARDRIEARDAEFQRRVRAGYERLAADGELTVIDGRGDPDAVAARLWPLVAALGA
ncbi:MAG: dTMP kinase [Planctomycetota bacterium]|nr:dTMP kinase [Planctomycetota bacterium]MCX8039550.1 dTMP kinase [Planctomycetota bacterium]MDW8373365.1 dTMP kinase [Planctomycetota bacterium]